MAKDVIGMCKLCGNTRKLSKEHLPPSKAYNFGEYKVQSIDKYKTKGATIWQTKKKQGGHFAYVLCVECNNRTGQWYGGEYVKLARACAPFANPSNAGQVVTITAQLFPLRVFKQALTILSATSETEMDAEWIGLLSPAVSDLGKAKSDRDISFAADSMPLIRQFILEKEANGMPKPFHLYAYLTGNPVGRATGIVKSWSRSTGASMLFAEFAWWPLGWVIVFNGQLKENLLDVTNWSQHTYDEEVAITLKLPCFWLESRMPLDFRTPEQVVESKVRNQAIIDAGETQDHT